MRNMSLANFPSMEVIPLEDVDRTDMEYRLLMAYAQRRLPASKYGQILQKEAKSWEGSSVSREQTPAVTPAEQGKAPEGLPPEDRKASGRRKSRKKKKKKRSSWRHLLLPSCLCGRPEEVSGKDAVNGQLPRSPADPGTKSATEPKGDLGIALVAERLVELAVSTPCPVRIEGRKGLLREASLEEDGGQTSKVVAHSDGNDKEEEIICTIVALLRKSGDALEEKMKKDKSFSDTFWDFMSYSFFRRIASQFLEGVPADPTRDSEDDAQSMKLAHVMEVTTRLTAIDTHPMNLVLGFGTKYLKESFRPWVCSRGGWEKALGLLDQDEEVE